VGARTGFVRTSYELSAHGPVTAIRRSDVEAFATRLARSGAKNGTIALQVGVLRQILGALVKDGVIERHPAAILGRIGPKPAKARPPTRSQLDALMDAASARARPVIEIAVSTGLRRGEIFALRWNEVDFSQRQIRVATSKTDAGERIVPMFGSARKTLLEEKAGTRFQRPQDYVFPTSVGTKMNATSWIVGEFYPAMKRTGLEKAFRFHDLRHYAVSRLIQQGANILLVSRVAGHSRPSITLDFYSHLFDEELVEAADRFDPFIPIRGVEAASR